MGGRGDKSGLPKRRPGRPRKNDAIKVVVQSGDEIDLSDSPLAYDDPDPSVTGEIRKAVEAFEARRVKMKVEYGTAFTADAKAMGEERGGHGSVRIPTSWLQNGAVFSHNHPRTGRDAGVLGGTFSKEDLEGWSYYNIRTFRATAAEGTYTITKGKNFDSQGMMQYVEKFEREITSNLKPKVDAINKQYKSGNLTGPQYLAEYNRLFNRSLVERHNALREGRKKYGYDYRLEKR